MKIDYLYEAGVFGSYKNKRSPESVRKAVSKELEHIAKTALLEKLYTKIEELINEYLSKNYDRHLKNSNEGLVLVGKNGNKKLAMEFYGGIYNIKDVMPIFRLAIENNTIVVILSCMPLYNDKIIVKEYMGLLDCIKYLKRFLNSNIERITETGLSFNYDGFDVKLEMDQDALDNDGRVKVDRMSINHIYNIAGIQKFVDSFYNQDIRIKPYTFSFYCSMSSNEMYKEYIKRFPNLIRSTGYIFIDMSAMTEFDLENLHITSVLADPNSDVEIAYSLKLDSGTSKASLQGIEKFIHNEYNMTLDEFKEIAYQHKQDKFDWDLRSPKNIKTIGVSYKYNNPKDIEIRGSSYR